MGKLDGNAYYLACYEDVAEGETAVAPAAVDPAAYMSEIEEFITKATVSWAGYTNMIVSAKFNH